MKRDWLFWICVACYAGGLVWYLIDSSAIDWRPVYDETHKFQTLVAGILAISGGAMALIGSRMQAQATLSVGENAEVERRRSIAAALYGELSNARLALTAQQMQMRRTAARLPSELPVKLVNTRAYLSDPLAVGCLPADLVYAATQAYDMLEVHNQSVRRILESTKASVDDNYPQYFAQRLDRPLSSLDVVLRGLSIYCDLDPEVAQKLEENARRLRAA